MTTQVNIHEAKTHLSRLVEQAAQGEEIVIAKHGRPRARLVPVVDRREPRKPGTAKGKVRILAGFYEADREIESMFYGEER
jgi:prevent-host-death family protein